MILKNLLPLRLKKFIKNVPLRFKSKKEIFNQYYRENKWGDQESRSGTGSNLDQTTSLRQSLPKLIHNYNISSLLDIPCGDYNWFKEIDFKQQLTYCGGDIVEELVQKNNKLYSTENIIFKNLDITKDKLPASDLILVRDCFVHLSFNDIHKAIVLIKESHSKYLLTTHFYKVMKNHNIPSGSFRKLNLTIEPFNFPDPIMIIDENCTEDEGKHIDKTMALWNINDLIE